MAEPLYENGFGILDDEGDFWTPKFYNTEKEAQARLVLKQMTQMDPEPDYTKYTVVPVTRTMRVKQEE